MVLACAVCNLPSQLLEGQDVPQPPLNAHQNLKSASCKIHSKTRLMALIPLFDHMECKKHRAGVVTLNLGQSLLSTGDVRDARQRRAFVQEQSGQ